MLREWLEKCGDEWESSYSLRVAWPSMLRIFSRGGLTIAPLERAWDALESQAKLGGGREASKRRKAALTAAAALSANSSSQSSVPNGSYGASYSSSFAQSKNGTIPSLPLPVNASIQNGAVDPAELARQLTLLDQDLFSQITLESCLEGPFTPDSYPTCFAVYLEWTQRITSWVTYSVLTSDSMRSRVKVFICFLECANHLRSMRNYNSLIAIAQGLINPNVSRLKQTTGAFHAKLSSIYQTISQLANPERNWEQLRDAQSQASKPTIPSIVTLLSDLTAGHAHPFLIQNAQTSSGRPLLNFLSLRQVAVTMEIIDSAQQIAYPFAEVTSIKNMLENIDVHATEEELEQASLYLEPPAGTERSFTKPKLLLTEEELRKLAEEATEDYRLSPGRPPNSPGAEWAVSLGRDGQEFEVIFIPGYRFYSRDTSYNVRIELEDGIAMIRAASLEKLIEHLTPAKSQHLSDDPDFLRIFFSTFHGYTTSATVLDLLAMRYQPPHLKSSEPEQIRQFQEKYETPIRNRVCAVLLYWLRKHPADFTNVSLRERVRDFLVEKVAICQPDWSTLLLTELDARVLSASISMRPSSANASSSGGRAPLSRSTSATPGTPASNSHSVASLEVLDFEVATVAMQLSLLVHEAWTRIRTSEMMNLSWIGPQAQAQSPNVMAFQGLIDKIVYNVEVELTRLLNANRHENLAKTIGAWLAVAQRSHEHLLCWPVAQSIVMVIQHCYTQELAAAWEKVPRQLVKYFHYARALFADRDRYLDAALAPFSEAAVSWRISTSAPLAMTAEVANSSPDALETPKLLTKSGVLPLDIILEDITQIEESHPNLLLEMGPRVINFEKFRLMSEIFHLVMLTQRSDYATTKPQGYSVTVEPRVRSWLLREPKPDEIPAQRFHSRFAQRTSIIIEGGRSSSPHLPRTSSTSSVGLTDSQQLRQPHSRQPSSSSQTSPPQTQQNGANTSQNASNRLSSSSNSSQTQQNGNRGGSGSSTTSPSNSPRSMEGESTITLSQQRQAHLLPANGSIQDRPQPQNQGQPSQVVPRTEITTSSPRKASTSSGSNGIVNGNGENRARSTSGGSTTIGGKRTAPTTPVRSPSNNDAKSPSRYYNAFLPKRGLARSQTERPSIPNQRLSTGPRDRPLPAIPLLEVSKASTGPINLFEMDPQPAKAPSSSSAPPSMPKQALPITQQAKRASPPRTLQVPTPETFLSILKSNSNVLNGMIAEVFAEETEKFLLSPEMGAIIRAQNQAKSDTDYRLVLAMERESADGRRTQIKRTMNLKYPSYQHFSSSRHLDASGAVYGFTYPVILEIADTAQQNGEFERAICDITAKADIAHVSLLFRGAALHRSVDPTCPEVLKPFLLAETFTESAVRAAEKCGVVLVAIPTKPSMEPSTATPTPNDKKAASPFQRRKLAPSFSSSSIPNGPRISAARANAQQ